MDELTHQAMSGAVWGGIIQFLVKQRVWGLIVRSKCRHWRSYGYIIAMPCVASSVSEAMALRWIITCMEFPE